MKRNCFYVSIICFVVGISCLLLTSCSNGYMGDRNINIAISTMKEAENTHQTFVDFPEFCNEKMGTVEFHKWWVNNYKRVVEVLKECKHNSTNTNNVR